MLQPSRPPSSSSVEEVVERKLPEEKALFCIATLYLVFGSRCRPVCVKLYVFGSLEAVRSGFVRVSTTVPGTKVASRLIVTVSFVPRPAAAGHVDQLRAVRGGRIQRRPAAYRPPQPPTDGSDSAGSRGGITHERS